MELYAESLICLYVMHGVDFDFKSTAASNFERVSFLDFRAELCHKLVSGFLSFQVNTLNF